MKKSFVKVVAIFSIIFMSFFIKSMSVSATEYYNCDYSSPLTYMDENNIPTNLQLSLKFKVPYHAIQSWNPVGLLPGTRFSWEVKSSTNSVNSFCLNKGTTSNSYNFGFKLNDPINYVQNNDGPAVTNINQYVINTFVSLDLENNNSPYIMVYVKNGSLKTKSVGQSVYEKYLKNTQYKDMTSSNRLYNLITLNGLENDTHYSDDNCVYSCHVNGLGEFEDKNNTIFNYVKKSGGIVFVNTNQAETYPTQKLTSVKQMISIAQDANGNALSQERKDKILNGLSQVVDTNTKDSVSYTKAYYSASRTKWATYMRENLESRAEATRREYFGKWFNKSVARYTLEESPQQFLTYWKYKFPNDCTTSACDFDGNGNSASDREVYNGVINAINNIMTYNNGSDCLTQIQNDPCISICSSSSSTCPSGTALNQCQNSETYRTCHSCATRCSNIGSASAKEQCYNSCTQNNYSSMRNSVRNAQQEAANSFATTMLSISEITLPHFESDTFKPYTIKCDDVKVFHTIYVILQIAAPIAVIIFGSLDYAKAVIASDVEKMEKSKKKFPKRLLLLVLFVVIPIVINAILSLYSMSTDKDMDTSLMYCIIKG